MLQKGGSVQAQHEVNAQAKLEWPCKSPDKKSADVLGNTS